MRIPLRFTLALLLVAGLATGGCATATDLLNTAQQAATGAPMQSGWDVNATQFNGRNGLQVIYQCEPGGRIGSVWGTDVYTDDSSVCSAAVHMGLITQERGGTVRIQIAPGRDSYNGTRRNGVNSSNYGSWGGSFVFVR
jgi:hypothetical protein